MSSKPFNHVIAGKFVTSKLKLINQVSSNETQIQSWTINMSFPTQALLISGADL